MRPIRPGRHWRRDRVTRLHDRYVKSEGSRDLDRIPGNQLIAFPRGTEYRYAVLLDFSPEDTPNPGTNLQ